MAESRRWLFLPALLVVGISLAAISYLLIMQSAGWKSGKLHGVPLIALNLGDADVYLLESDNNRKYFASVGGNYDVILEEWRKFFRDRQIPYVDIKTADLVHGLKPGVLILPSAVALGNDEREAVRKFEDAGGSLLASWATGARDGTGGWRGWNFLEDQFGVSLDNAGGKPGGELIPQGGSPLSHTLAAGTRIALFRSEETPLAIKGSRKPAAVFSDGSEAVSWDEANGSRRVLLAFSETAWHADPQKIYSLLADTLDWLHHKPDSYLAAWPYPKKSALMIAMDAGQEFQNAGVFGRLVAAEGASATFYCLTSAAAPYQAMVRELEKRHEIGYQGDMPLGFSGEAEPAQAARIDRMLAQMKPLLSSFDNAVGFHPPLGLYDATTKKVLAEKGLVYLLADKAKNGLPQFSRQNPEKGLVELPRIERDDSALLQAGLAGDALLQAMESDFDFSAATGSLGVLATHSQNFAPGGPLEKALPEFLRHAKGNDVWVTQGRQIAKWWRSRARFKYELAGDPKHMGLDVSISAPGIELPAAIVVLNPVRGELPNITATKVGMPLPEVSAIDEFSTAIVFRDIPPGDYNYYLSF